MHYLFLLLFLSSSINKSQSIALLDRNFRMPVTYTDSVTLDVLGKGAFPIYLSDVRPVIDTIQEVRKKINQNRYHSSGTDKIYIGHSRLVLGKEVSSSGAKYLLTLSTESNGFTTYIELVKGNFDRAAQQRVVAFLDYLSDNIIVADHTHRVIMDK
ncbi:MAG: hypothetical protein ICV65_04250 [Flavisolibacter sp.]|nr:hypothetical protein [Flavisolibacter sp.]